MREGRGGAALEVDLYGAVGEGDADATRDGRIGERDAVTESDARGLQRYGLAGAHADHVEAAGRPRCQLHLHNEGAVGVDLLVGALPAVAFEAHGVDRARFHPTDHEGEQVAGHGRILQPDLHGAGGGGRFL